MKKNWLYAIFISCFLITIIIFWNLYNKKEDTNDDIDNIDKNVFIFFNRVPKCGSTTMIYLVRKLAKRNRFNIYESSIHDREILEQKELTELKDWIYSFQETSNVQFTSTVFFRHMSFVNLEKVNKDVVYLNILRDPVERFESGFNYIRMITRDAFGSNHACFGREKIQSIKNIIKKSWVDQNFHAIPNSIYMLKLLKVLNRSSVHQCANFSHGMKYVNYDLELKDRLQQQFTPWLNKSLFSCVRNQSDPECNDFTQARENRRSSFVDILLNRMAGTENLIEDNPLQSPLILYPSSVNYFCETSPFSNEEGGDQAIANMDKYYSVVAVLEMMEKSLAVLERKLPRIFAGAVEIYKKMKRKGSEKLNSQKREKTDKETRRILAENLKGEYKLYNHAVRKIEEQYNQL